MPFEQEEIESAKKMHAILASKENFRAFFGSEGNIKPFRLPGKVDNNRFVFPVAKPAEFESFKKTLGVFAKKVSEHHGTQFSFQGPAQDSSGKWLVRVVFEKK